MAAVVTFDGRTYFGNHGFVDTSVYVALYTNTGMTASSNWSAVAVATFPGYAQQLATMGTVFLNGADKAESDITTVTFTATSDPLSPQTIIGYALHDSVGDLLLAFEDFTSPPVVAVSGDSVSVTISLTLTQA